MTDPDNQIRDQESSASLLPDNSIPSDADIDQNQPQEGWRNRLKFRKKQDKPKPNKKKTFSLPLYISQMNLVFWLLLPDRIPENTQFSGQYSAKQKAIWFSSYLLLTVVIASLCSTVFLPGCQRVEFCETACKAANNNKPCPQGPTLVPSQSQKFYFKNSPTFTDTYWFNTTLYDDKNSQGQQQQQQQITQIPISYGMCENYGMVQHFTFSGQDLYQYTSTNSISSKVTSFVCGQVFNQEEYISILCVKSTQAPTCTNPSSNSLTTFLHGALSMIIVSPTSWLILKLMRFVANPSGRFLNCRRACVYPIIFWLMAPFIGLLIFMIVVHLIPNAGRLFYITFLSWLFDNLKDVIWVPVKYYLSYNRLGRKSIELTFLQVYPEFEKLYFRFFGDQGASETETTSETAPLLV